MASLSLIQHYIATKQHNRAKRELVKFLRVEPRSVTAWMLLAALLNDVDKQMDCYRRVLALEPGHPEASTRLQQLTYRLPPTAKGAALRCSQCGGRMNVRFVGDLRDKRAVCIYCGTEVDLPDSYQRIELERQHETHEWSTRTVEKAIIQTRNDGPAPASPLPTPPADIAARRSALTYIEQRLTVPHKPTMTERVLTRLAQGLLGGKIRLPPDGVADASGTQPRELSPSDIIDLAGGPLPPEERRQCPKCQATISKKATRCEWCGVQIADGEW